MGSLVFDPLGHREYTARIPGRTSTPATFYRHGGGAELSGRGPGRKGPDYRIVIALGRFSSPTPFPQCTFPRRKGSPLTNRPRNSPPRTPEILLLFELRHLPKRVRDDGVVRFELFERLEAGHRLRRVRVPLRQRRFPRQV